MRKKMMLCLLVPFLQGCNQDPPTGRFQIIAGTYDDDYINITTSPPEEINKLHHGIFKVDTQTGQVWEYHESTTVTNQSNGTTRSLEWNELKTQSVNY